MSSDQSAFHSLSGQAETAEPAGTSGPANDSGAALPKRHQSPKPSGPAAPSQQGQRAQSTVATTAAPALRKSPSGRLTPAPVASPASGSSPQSSRNSSPVHKETKAGISAALFAPQPSAAAIQRAWSATSVPSLPVTNSNVDAPKPVPRSSKSAGPGVVDTALQWPTSPRLKSPPLPSPTHKKVEPLSLKKTETVKKAEPMKKADVKGGEEKKAEQPLPVPKSVARGASGKSPLATVQENADAGGEIAQVTDGKAKQADVDRPQYGESGNESTESRAERRSRRSSITQPKQSARSAGTVKGYAPLGAAKSRQAEGKQNMTVETETVASVPQSGLAERAASGRNDVSTLRLKPSSETIRPRKDRRKPGAKARSINQGTASTKADLFEARVASAVDEANTSDSDETFVYESNPEPRRSRHHSRTPSVASLHSIVDTQRAMLRTAGEMDTPRVTGKRSFKFSNPPFSDVDSADNGGGTVRAYQPRYIGGKYGRGVSHASTVEDSPFTQATKSRSTHTLRPSRPPSPRSPSGQQRVSLFSRKDNLFDFDPEACDDERTPLVGSIRSPRGLGRTHRTHYERHPRSRFRRFGGCLLGACVLMAVVLSTVAFLALSNRPLSDVRVQRIDNVLASEDELMLDLVVSAVNPNVLGIAVGSMDINVFAKSPHVAAMTGGVDDGTDPPGEDLGRDAHTMLLGRIFDFDQALSFGGSPLKHHAHSSRGELRLAHPGNVTKAGEQNRWERTIQHPFELIIRGVLQYQLPISNHMQRVSVGASVMVHPEDGIDETGRMRVKPLRPREREGMRLDWRR